MYSLYIRFDKTPMRTGTVEGVDGYWATGEMNAGIENNARRKFGMWLAWSQCSRPFGDNQVSEV
jgi:hypothetical protein